MADTINKIDWHDRKHFMWFPFSFTVYEVGNERLYQKTGLFNTKYDEVLLYRIMDLTLQRTFLQKLFGTGTLILKCKVDSSGEIELKNIKNPIEVKNMLSNMIEEVREKRRVVGKEFYGNEFSMHDEDCCYDMDDIR